MLVDVAIVGGGIVGIATAHALSRAKVGRVVVLEAEEQLARHQSGRNSGVIHAGLYYRPGSLKARTCAAGREATIAFCEHHGIPYRQCGKVVVATSPREMEALAELERRGCLNGLDGLERLGPERLREMEPHVSGVGGLFVPQTGVVDFVSVTEALAERVRERGGEVRFGIRVTGCRVGTRSIAIETTRGEVECRNLIGCAGLHADRLAHMAGVDPGLRLVPFRGEYYEIVEERAHLCRALIYPVPDPALPFLGVHLTRTISGKVEIGPNAVLAFGRHGYDWLSASARDLGETLRYPGFWRMLSRQWRAGIGEMHRSLSKRAFVRAVQKLVPEIREADVRRTRAGVRAQAVEPDGTLCDDFRIVGAPRMIHVLSAPSPAATACPEIGRTIAQKARAELGL